MQFIAVASELRMMTERAVEVLRTIHPGEKEKDYVKY